MVLAVILSAPFHTSTGSSTASNAQTGSTTVPDFSIQCCFSTGDGTVQVTAGQTYSSWGWVYSLNGFAGTVSLSLNVPFPSSITPSVTLTSGAMAEPDISISPPASTPGGTYTGSITGSSGSVTHTIPLSITVYPASPPQQGLVCFSPTTSSCPSSPAKFSAPLGGSFTAYVVIQGSRAFTGFNIWFQYPYGILDATGVSLGGSVLPDAKVQFECVDGQGSSGCGYWLGNGPGIVALYATGNQTAAPTTGLLYSVTFKVTGNGSGGFGFFCVTSPSGPWMLDCASVFNGSTDVNVGVQGATFTTGPGSGSTITVQQTISFHDVTATLSGGLTADNTTRMLIGSISVFAVNSTTGQTLLSRTFTISIAYGSSPSIKFVLLIPASSILLGAVCTVNLGNNQASCFLAKDPDMAGAGFVNIVDVGIIFGDYGAVNGSALYNPSADLDGSGTVDIVDASVVISVYGAPVFV